MTLVNTLTHTYVYIFVEQGQAVHSKQPRGKKTDMCAREMIIKHELCMGCRVKK